jgi:hypothetical protein
MAKGRLYSNEHLHILRCVWLHSIMMIMKQGTLQSL